MVKLRLFGKKKSFTLVELLVTMGIIILITTISMISLGTARQGADVASNGDELKRIIEETKSFANGPDRERTAHYILIIETGTGPNNYCNQDPNNPGFAMASNPNNLKKNEYMICSTANKDISSYTNADLNSKFNRVRAAHLDYALSIVGKVGTNTQTPIIVNIRTYDGQVGYNLRYCGDSGITCPGVAGGNTLDISLSKDNVTKKLTVNPVANTVMVQ